MDQLQENPNEKIINWTLSCDSAEAHKILSQELDSPYKIWFLPSFYKKNWVQGKVKRNKFKAWTKGPRKGGPPTIIEGQILPSGEKSILQARIRVLAPYNSFKMNPWMIIPLIFIAQLVFIMMMLGMHMPQKSYLAWIGFPFFFLLAVVGLIGFMGLIGREEVVELDAFMNRIFADYKINENK